MKTIIIKIKKIIFTISEKYKYITKAISPTILSSSMAFYLLIVYFPITLLITELLKKLQIDTSSIKYLWFLFSFSSSHSHSTLLSNIILLISIIWISSKIINMLSLSTDTIYNGTNKKRFIIRLSSFITMILLITFIIFIIILLILISTFIDLIFSNIIVIGLIKYIIQLIGIILIISIIYKLIIPIKIRFKYIILISTCVIIAINILNYIYDIILMNKKLESYIIYYGQFAKIFILFVWIYNISSIFIYGILVLYYISTKK